MQVPVAPILDELNALKQEGVDSIYLSDEAITILKEGNIMPVDVFGSISEPVVVSKDKILKEEKQVEKKIDKKSLIPKLQELDIKGTTKRERWESLQNIVLNCAECNRHVKPGKKVVFGVGNIDADIFFCGEAPGADEEIQGEPFVGEAGQLLNKIIQAMGFARKDVYIGNIMNWRPEMESGFGSRSPTQEEMEFCLPYLKAQVDIVQPKVVVALGATAVHGLLGHDSTRRMGDARGNWFEFAGRPLMVTFHPSYLLRNNTNRTKRLVWEDLLQVMEKIHLPISEKQKAYFS